MRKNVEKVTDALARGEAHSEKTVWTDGRCVYSYRMLIAVVSRGVAYVVDRAEAPTQTTRMHLSGVREAFQDYVECSLEELEAMAQKPENPPSQEVH